MSNAALKPQLTQLIKTALDTTSKLRSSLKENDISALNSSMDSVVPMAERFERLLRTTGVEGLMEAKEDLDSSAIALWNITSMAMKCEPVKVKKILCSVKFLACLLMSIGELLDTKSLKLKFRSIGCLIKSLKSSVDEELIPLAQKIQEHTDRKYQVLESIHETFERSVEEEFVKIKVELFIIKMEISILEGDIEMAKLYEERSGLSQSIENIDSRVVLESSRVIYNTCLKLWEKKDFENVIYFMNKIVPNIKSFYETDTKILVYSMLSLLANSCFELKTSDAFQKAEQVVQLLQDIDPTSLESFKFDIKLKKLQKVHPQEIEQTIVQMLMSVPVVSNFKSILSIINDHATSDPLSAIKCYEFALTNKLDPTNDQEAMEMLLIAMVNAYIQDSMTPVDIKQEKLGKFLNITEKLFIKSISKKTSSTTVTLLWTAGKKEIKNNNHGDAIYWFKLILHRMIQVNEEDKGKAQRALQNCYINIGEYDEGLKVYESMNEDSQKNIISQYNLFKIYAETNDEDKIMSCLKRIFESNEQKAVPLLSLCAINSKTNSRIAIESMLKLFKKINQQKDSNISIPKTLRCVIELILKELAISFQTDYISTLITLLTEAHKFAKDTIKIPNYKFTIDELKWFSSQAFNIARSCLLNKEFINGQMIAQIAVNFISLITDDISVEESLNNKTWSFRARLVEIMCMSQLENVSQEVLWGSIRQKSLNLRVTVEESKIVYQSGIEFDKFEDDWKQILIDATIFQYQSELELGNYTVAKTIIRETLNIKNLEYDTTLINILMNDKFPDSIKPEIISEIIKKNLDNSSIEGNVLSRWVRLLLTNSINQSSEAEHNCLNILDKIIQRIRSSGAQEQKLPSHEIEWISSSCWNNGVNKMFNDEKVSGKNWCMMAIKLAGFINERFELNLNKLWDELVTSL